MVCDEEEESEGGGGMREWRWMGKIRSERGGAERSGAVQSAEWSGEVR